MKKKRLFINLIANFIAFFVNVGISFFLTPFIIENVSSEAYGFIGLGNNFVLYASIGTLALNSMAGRYISIQVHQNNISKANQYFNSILFSNVIISTALFFVSIFVIFNLDNFLNISTDLYRDVQTFYFFIFLNFILMTITSVFSVSTFVKNRLDLVSLRNIEANIIKVIVLLTLFYILSPSIVFIGIATLASTIFAATINFVYFKKLTPELKISSKFFSLKSILEVTSSGIWNSIVRLGQLMLNGFDLLFANILIGSAAMGTLAVAKTMPTFISSLVAMIAAVFMPSLTYLYAKGKNSEMLAEIKKSMNLMGVMISIPVSSLFIFGDKFYKLWVPSQDATELQIISIISIFTIVFSGSINILYNVFTVMNKLKLNALWLIGTGILNIVIVFTLLKTTNLELYAIAGVSTLISISRNLLFTVPYGAKILGMNRKTFFPEVGKGFFAVIVASTILYGHRLIFSVYSWSELFFVIFSGTVISLIINIFFILNHQERLFIIDIIKSKIFANRRKI